MRKYTTWIGGGVEFASGLDAVSEGRGGGFKVDMRSGGAELAGGEGRLVKEL